MSKRNGLKKGLVLCFLMLFCGSFFYFAPLSFAADYESIEVIDSARMLSLSKVNAGYRKGTVTLEGGNIRVRKDGQAMASSTEGHLYSEGDTITLQSKKDVVHLSFIRTSGNTSTTTIHVSYED